MLKLFSNICSMLIVLGIILFAASFYTNISIWYGVEIVKSGGALFIMFMFMHLLAEQQHDNTKGDLAESSSIL